MFQDIFTEDNSLTKEDREAGYALLMKYLIEKGCNLGSIQDLKNHIADWVRDCLNDSDPIDVDQLKEFIDDFKSYIPGEI